MNIVVITGKMGTGKTTLCQKIARGKMGFFRRPFVFFSADEEGKKLRNAIFSYTAHQWKWLLFYSPYQKKYWALLEKKLHPLIKKTIAQRWSGIKTQKGTFFIDIALTELIPANIAIQKKIIMNKNNWYQRFFVLARQRKMPARQILKLMQKQENL